MIPASFVHFQLWSSLPTEAGCCLLHAAAAAAASAAYCCQLSGYLAAAARLQATAGLAGGGVVVGAGRRREWGQAGSRQQQSSSQPQRRVLGAAASLLDPLLLLRPFSLSVVSANSLQSRHCVVAAAAAKRPVKRPKPFISFRLSLLHPSALTDTLTSLGHWLVSFSNGHGGRYPALIIRAAAGQKKTTCVSIYGSDYNTRVRFPHCAAASLSILHTVK